MPTPIALTGSFNYLNLVQFTSSYVEISTVRVDQVVSGSLVAQIFPDSASFALGKVGRGSLTLPQSIQTQFHDFTYNEADGDLNLYHQAYNALQNIAPFNSFSAIIS
tara:strand:- start:442 stop:762 length:321 start_codon:yes stop_codon:yes gene_type:complete